MTIATLANGWAGRALGLFLTAGAALALNSQAQAVEVVRVVSPGGIEAWLVEDHIAPVIAVQIAFEGGAALDPEGMAGLAEMTSGLIDEGAGDLDSQAFQGRLDDLSISLSFDAFVDTYRGSMRTLSRNKDEAFSLLSLALSEPRFDEPAVERIRGQIQSILARQENDPDRIASRTFWQAVFPEHPYGRPRRGTPESVADITVDAMRDFVGARFARDNLVVGVAGDITPEVLAPLLDETFGPLPANAQAFTLEEGELTAVGETIVVEQDTPQSSVLFGQRGLKRDDPDYYAAYVLNHLLGGGSFTSRLYEEVREKRGLAYSVGSFLSPMDRAALWMGSVGTANESVAESLATIRAEWARVRDEPIDGQEFADTITNLTGSFPLRLGSTVSLARMLVGMQLADLGIDYIDRRNSIIEAVTLEDVERVAQRVLSPESLTFVVVGKPEGVTATRPAEGG